MAFTLVETLVVLVLSATIFTATLGVYQHIRDASVMVDDRMSQHRLQNEIMQKITEDIDRLAVPGVEVTINFHNRSVKGTKKQLYNSGQLILNNSFYGINDKKQVYEEIVWQTSYDPGKGKMILYRMHDGLNAEDRLLEGDASLSINTGLYIPVASGVTFFEIRTQQGENVLTEWASKSVPKAVRVGLSFAEHEELEKGVFVIPEKFIVYRKVAIDRTRKIPFQVTKVNLGDLVEEEHDYPNNLSVEKGETDVDLENETE